MVKIMEHPKKTWDDVGGKKPPLFLETLMYKAEKMESSNLSIFGRSFTHRGEVLFPLWHLLGGKVWETWGKGSWVAGKLVIF